MPEVTYYVNAQTWNPRSMSMGSVLSLLSQAYKVYVADIKTKARVGRFVLTTKGYAYIKCGR